MITSDRMSIVVPGLDSTAKVGALQNGLNHSFVNFFMMMHIMMIKPSSSSVEPESPLCKLAGLNSRPWSRRWCPFLPRWKQAGHRPWCPLEKAIVREQQWLDMASYMSGYSPAKPWNPCNLATSDIHFKNDYDYDYVETWWISLEFIWQRPPQPLQPLQPCNFRGVDDIAQRTPQPPQPCNLWETPIITLRNLATSETL